MARHSILFVGPSWVGDMVMAQSLFKIVKTADPECSLDVLAPAWSLPIVARMPEIRSGIASETGHGELGLGKRRKIGQTLRAQNYDRAIIIPRSFKSALIPWFANIPIRTGFRGESRYFLINDVRELNRDILDQTVKRFVALGVGAGEPMPEIPYPILQVSKERQQDLVLKQNLDTSRPVIGMMPGAEYGPAKCWPLEYFRELAERLDQSGFSVWVLGSEKDRESGDVIAANGHATNLCGQTALVDVIDLLALCQQVVSNDSGLMHVAAAVGVHVHGIYGSSSPLFTPPLTHKRDIHSVNLDCSPCFERHCPLGHLRCLRDILPSEIHAKIV
ncbi:MAG TPA: lipopolysaccharide heptosyltransferase II [Woeseiaceae bacterium]|nr:lipopolysaccharide heptosyltransferase II [Woeseiaceae bacterium]